MAILPVMRMLLLITALLLSACEPADQALDLAGTLERERIALRVEVNEVVVQRWVEQGDRVAAGDLLLTLDDRRRRAALEVAEAELARAMARLAELQRGPRREEIDEARARLRGAEQDLAAARVDLDRAEDLVEQQLAAERTYDQAKREFDLAFARRDESSAALEAMLAGTTIEELLQAEASVAAAAAEVTGRTVDLEQTQLIATRDGLIERWLIEEGERATITEPVGILVAARPHALVWVPGSLRSRVQVGDQLPVLLDGWDQPLTGTVEVIAAEPAFTPFHSLNERDRPRLAFRMEVTLEDDPALAAGTGLRVLL